jgi:uncharacterized protein (TIGR00369 family)
MSHLTLEQIQAMLDSSPMIQFMGVRVTSVDPGNSTVGFALPMRAEFERLPGSGQIHGGAIANFADTAGDFAVALLVGEVVPTINIRVDFLRPASGPQLTATAVVRKLGRSVAVVDIDVFGADGKLVAVGRGTYGGSGK